MNIKEKLLNIQSELKAPKGQYNSFGKYKYRNCEDILESVKPLLKKYNCVLNVTDDILGFDGRFYIKATAILTDTQTEEKIENCGFAREEETKKGMDGSQITGSSSSYARKYALNGLFCIDDTKDSDTDEFQNQQKKSNEQTKTKIDALIELAKSKGVTVLQLESKYRTKDLAKLTDEQYSTCVAGLQKMVNQND